MKIRLLVFVAASFSCFSSMAYAKSGWTDIVKIVELVATSRHYYEIRLPVTDNPSGCKQKHWFFQDYDAPGADKIFDVLLEGIKSEIQISVYVTGICNINGYSQISSVRATR